MLMTQTSFLDDVVVVEEELKVESLICRFRKIHASRPNVYKEFKRVSLKMIDQGYKKYSAYGIMHIVRFLTAVSMGDDEPYKIGNDFTPAYARMFVKEFPKHADFFEIRYSKKFDDHLEELESYVE